MTLELDLSKKEETSEDVSLAPTRRVVDEAVAKLDELKETLDGIRSRIQTEFDQAVEEARFSKLDREFLPALFAEPYVLIPKKEGEWYVVVPRAFDFQVGWLERATSSYNVFVINRYLQWFSEIPPNLRGKLNLQKPEPYKVFEGTMLTGKDKQEEALARYRPFVLQREGEDRLKVKKGQEFNLIAQLVKDGTLPFMQTPVQPEDLRDFSGIVLRDYQQEAWEMFLHHGAIGVFWSFGAGKSLLGNYVLGRLKGRKLVVVPTRTLLEQWVERAKRYDPQNYGEVDIVTYQGYDKVKDREYTVAVFDECQHLPANTFSRFATMRTKYRIGFSGSPYREDGRENLIIALTGFPVGLSWDQLRRLKVIRTPTFRVYILKDDPAKMAKLRELLRIPLKTIIFCDELDKGQRISKEFGIPFVFGETSNRLEVIREAETSVVSRVGDEGLSVPDLERVIEVAFLRGSRMQESQRFGRLMHSQADKLEHIVLMTEVEFEAYEKRLYSITERGFRIEFVR